jgi:hypothetical protein
MEKNFKIHHVRIVRKHCRCFVIPGTLFVSPGDEVEFISINEGEVNIFFPRGNYFDPEKRVVDLNGKNEFRDIVKVPEEASSGVYFYSVFCEKSEDFAEGNTPPTMIVEKNK